MGLVSPILWLIRHAPPAEPWDRDVFLGQRDVPVNLTASEHELEQIARRFDSIETIFSSPLIRSRRTAEQLFPGRLVVIEPRLTERSLGELEGLDKNDLREQIPEAFDQAGRLKAEWVPLGGETLRDVSFRVGSFLAELATQRHPQSVAITHNGVIRCVQAQLSDGRFGDGAPHLAPIRVDLDLCLGSIPL